MADDFDPYAVLHVSPDADAEVIQAAYRTLARRHHPDLSSDPDAGARMAELNAAWGVLGDPIRRADHDRTARAVASAPAASAKAAEKAATQAGPAGSAGSARAGTSTGWRAGANGEGAAGPPPGRPSGSVLSFGRHIGWSLGEIVRVDPGYLAWLARSAAGEPYRAEIEDILVRGGYRQVREAPPRKTARKSRFGFP